MGWGFIFNRAVIWSGANTSVNDRLVLENTAPKPQWAIMEQLASGTGSWEENREPLLTALTSSKLPTARKSRVSLRFEAPRLLLNARCCWRPSNAALHILNYTLTDSGSVFEVKGKENWHTLLTFLLVYYFCNTTKHFCWLFLPLY